MQEDADPKKRKNQGLESVLREIFPISSYDGNTTLEYLYYELGKPRYTSQECRQLRLTYGRPLRIWLRLNREEPHRGRGLPGRPADHDGWRRVHHQRCRARRRQPVAPQPRCRLRAGAGHDDRSQAAQLPRDSRTGFSWIEVNVTKKDALTVRIDQSGKFAATTLLRAMDPKFSTDADLLNAFYETKT